MYFCVHHLCRVLSSGELSPKALAILRASDTFSHTPGQRLPFGVYTQLSFTAFSVPVAHCSFCHHEVPLVIYVDALMRRHKIGAKVVSLFRRVPLFL